MTHFIDRLNAYILVLYYVLIMVFGVLIKNPMHLAVIFVSGVIMAGMVAGWRVTLRTLGYSMILGILVIIINPLVSKEGMTRIVEIGNFYITLESVVYGAVSTLMLMSVFMWFVSFNVVMTGDKYIYVLGRFLPSFSILISLTLRLIPELNRTFEEQKASIISMGMFTNSGFKDKFRCNMYALKGVIKRSIESSTIRADSMEARGYGAVHRSSYLRYKLRCRDMLFCVLTIVIGGMVIAGHVLGHSYASYYPIININIENNYTYTMVSLFVMVLYVSIPIIFELSEEALWKRYLLKVSQ